MTREGRHIKPIDQIRREKIIPPKVKHAETELQAQVSSYIAKKELTVKEAVEVLTKIAKSWEPVILIDERFNKGE
jgi:predicted phage tail protein